MSDPHTSVRQREIRYAIASSIVALLVAGVVIIETRQGTAGARGGSGLLMIRSGGAGGSGVASTPAVDSQQINERLMRASAATGGELEISLAWNGTSDLDLQVREPSGEVVAANHRRSEAGGLQDVDANPTMVTEEGSRRAEDGESPGPENVVEVPDLLFDLDKVRDRNGTPFREIPGMDQLLRGRDGYAPPIFSRSPVEHIYYAQAPRGSYSILASCYSWREPNRSPLPFTLQIRSHGQVCHEESGQLGPASFVAEGAAPVEVCEFQVNE